MSYPKVNPLATGSRAGSDILSGRSAGLKNTYSSNNVKDPKAQKRREQLLNLLVNKFRGKYGVELDDNNDRLIRAEVSRFLETDQMTEVNLIKLDKRLQEILIPRASAASS